MVKIYVCTTQDGEFDNSQMIAKATSKEQALVKFRKLWAGAEIEDIYEVKLEDGAGYLGKEDNE